MSLPAAVINSDHIIVNVDVDIDVSEVALDFDSIHDTEFELDGTSNVR